MRLVTVSRTAHPQALRLRARPEALLDSKDDALQGPVQQRRGRERRLPHDGPYRREIPQGHSHVRLRRPSPNHSGPDARTVCSTHHAVAPVSSTGWTTSSSQVRVPPAPNTTEVLMCGPIIRQAGRRGARPPRQTSFLPAHDDQTCNEVYAPRYCLHPHSAHAPSSSFGEADRLFDLQRARHRERTGRAPGIGDA